MEPNKMISLRNRLLREIESSPIPIRTPDLVLICAPDRPHRYQQVWSELRKLERDYFVSRSDATSRDSNRYAVAWSLCLNKPKSEPPQTEIKCVTCNTNKPKTRQYFEYDRGYWRQRCRECNNTQLRAKRRLESKVTR